MLLVNSGLWVLRAATQLAGNNLLVRPLQL